METAPRTAPHLDRGEWSEGPDAVMIAWDLNEGADGDTVLRSLGYSYWTAMGFEDDGSHDGPRLSVYSSSKGDGLPRFVLEVDGGESTGIDYLYIATLPDLMQTLAQWAPAIRRTPSVDISRVVKKLEQIGDKLDRLDRSVGEFGMSAIAGHLETIAESRR